MLDKEWLKNYGYDTTGIEGEKYKKKKEPEIIENNKSNFKEPTLVNINGICYMNVVLQCFHYCNH